MNQALEALQFIDPSLPRVDWVRIALACRAAGLSEDDFIQWSSGGSNFKNDAEARSVFNKTEERGNITAGTLFYYAQQAGYKLKRDGSVAEKITAQSIWDAGSDAPASNPYIQRKWGTNTGLKICNTDYKLKSQSMRGALMIPGYTGSRVNTIQFITDDEKLNMRGEQGDAYFTLGNSIDVFYFCEGIGQAWAIKSVVENASAVVCFGSHRVKSVINTVRRKHPGAQLIIVPDRGKENDADKIARDIGGSYIVLPEEKPSNYDINDLLQDDGFDAARRIIENPKVYSEVTQVCQSSDHVWFCDHEEQKKLFAGYYYINSESVFLTPSGSKWDKDQFNSKFSNRIFLLDADSEQTTRAASYAFLNNTVNPKIDIDETYFNPNKKYGEIMEEVRGDSVIKKMNTYVPYDLIHREGDVKIFLDYINKMLPHGDDSLMLLSYMAACVQYLGVKFTYMPLLQGIEGNGKSTIGTIMTYCIGERFCENLGQNTLKDNFDKWKEGSFFVFIDELKTFHERADIWEKMKTAITQDRQSMRKAYADAVTIQVFFNQIACTNYIDVYRKTETERRIMHLATAQQNKADLDRSGIREYMSKTFYPWFFGDYKLALLSELNEEEKDPYKIYFYINDGDVYYVSVISKKPQLFDFPGLQDAIVNNKIHSIDIDIKNAIVKKIQEAGYALYPGKCYIAHYFLNMKIPKKYNPLYCKEAPVTSTTAEAIESTREDHLTLLLETIEDGEMIGFRGGFISTIAANNLLKEAGVKWIRNRKKLGIELKKIGYVKHPALPGGKCTTIVGGTRHYLYVREDSDIYNMTDPNDVSKLYRDSNDPMCLTT